MLMQMASDMGVYCWEKGMGSSMAISSVTRPRVNSRDPFPLETSP